MKKIALIATATLIACSASARPNDCCVNRPHLSGYGRDLTQDIPEITSPLLVGFEKVPDVAQFKNADWNNVVGISRNITLAQACEIANQDPTITYFFHMKGRQMVLETKGGYRLFQHGDAVFFTGTPWWGSAEGFSDGYIKKSN